MRILYWIRSGDKLGSLERYTMLLARQCQQRRHELMVMHDIPNTVPAHREGLAAAGARYMIIGESWRRPLPVLHAVAHFVRAWKPDIVHAHFINPLALPMLRLVTNARLYWTFHSGIEGKITLRNRLAAKLRQATAHRLLADSERVRRDEIEAGVSPVRISTLYLGLDIDDLMESSMSAPLPLPPGYCDPATRKVITVGRFDPVKRVLCTANAAIQVLRRFPDVLWWFVGTDGTDKPELLRTVRQSGMEDRLIVLGKRDNVPALLKQAYLQVICSRSEGLPFTILEASALGVPTVAPNIGGIDEAILNGDTGVLVDKPSPDRLAEAASRFLSDNALRERMGRRAAQFVRETFDARIHIARLLDLYEKDADSCRKENAPECA